MLQTFTSRRLTTVASSHRTACMQLLARIRLPQPRVDRRELDPEGLRVKLTPITVDLEALPKVGEELAILLP